MIVLSSSCDVRNSHNSNIIFIFLINYLIFSNIQGYNVATQRHDVKRTGDKREHIEYSWGKKKEVKMSEHLCIHHYVKHIIYKMPTKSLWYSYHISTYKHRHN